MATGLQWSRQSVVSLILLALLCCIAAAILWVHQQSNRLSSSMSPLHEITPVSFGSLELIPGSFLTPLVDFDISGKQERYDAESLYEKINGKAPLYLEAGLSSLTTLRFMHRKDSSLWFELFVYDMGAALNAFAVYSTQRRAGAEVVPSLESYEHYKTENGLYLRHGAYYIECIGSSSSARLDDAMIAIGLDLLSADPGKGATISELQLFPDENLVEGSFKLILNSAFGSEVLHNTFVAKYRLGDQIVTGFISPHGSPEQAKQVAEGYYQFLVDSEGVAENTMSEMKLVDLYGLVEIIFAVGPYVAGIHEGEHRFETLEIGRRLRASLAETMEREK